MSKKKWKKQVAELERELLHKSRCLHNEQGDLYDAKQQIKWSKQISKELKKEMSSLLETLHIMGSYENYKRLNKSIKQSRDGDTVSIDDILEEVAEEASIGESGFGCADE